MTKIINSLYCRVDFFNQPSYTPYIARSKHIIGIGTLLVVTASYFTSSYRQNRWYPSVSYDLWRLFTPSIGYESLHCDTRRGFAKARKNETEVKKLLSQDNPSQKVGKLAQQGIYEIHNNFGLASNPEGIETIVTKLNLDEEESDIRVRVISLLKSYCQKPILADKNIIKLLRGDEGYPQPVLVQQGNYWFNLYPAFDCVLEEDDKTIHVLDFKTGKSNFDRRQANVYIVAASAIYADKNVTASFYNLETQEYSETIALSQLGIEAIKIELALISKKHEKQLSTYRTNSSNFYQIFPPNPGSACKQCPFASICHHSHISE